MSTPRIAQKSPFAVELVEGKKYAWCTCGESQTQPFCDGAHKGSDFAPQIFTAEESKTAYLCGCKSTANGPFCDGAHNQL